MEFEGSLIQFYKDDSNRNLFVIIFRINKLK